MLSQNKPIRMKRMKFWTTVAALMFAVILMNACKKDTYHPVVGLCPVVTATNPADQSVNVPVNSNVTVTFNEKMDPATITQSCFTLSGPATEVTGVLTYNDENATILFNPAGNLALNTTYTGRVSSSVKDPMGNALQTDYVWTFTTGATTDLTPPTIISTDPQDNATGVALNKVVKATFSEQMDPLTITTTSFTLKKGITPVAGVVTYSGMTASFTPNANLAASTAYTATITTLAEDLSGNAVTTNYTWNFNTGTTQANPQVVALNSVERFGIMAGVGISNNAGFSEIHNMDVGISPGVRSSVTGFPPAIIINGAIYASDDIAPPGVADMLIQAKQDLADAYLFAEGASSPAPATVAGDLGGITLTPGIYKSTSTLLIQSGNLTLDAQGNANAVWIFQIASDFTTVGGAGGNVMLIGGAQAKNIFWQTGSSATIGDFTTFYGNILALTSITMNSGAVATGRMLARNGSVIMTASNIINKP